jgi:uncharacterized protein (DUF1015 family)
MAEFVPFPGLRYNTQKVDLSNVICPPYDVIKGSARDTLAQRDAHNIVQVELATYYGQDATPQQYAASAHLLNEWREQGILVQDDPAFYLYEQEFSVPTSGEVRKRRGVLGALRLEEFGEGVQPHEHTLSGPKADRLNLLRATRTNTSPIFGLYSDSDGWVAQLLKNIAEVRPDAEAVDAEGVAHRLWKVTDDETVNAIDAALEDEPILIADGHHRYETALNFRNECRAQAEAEGKTWTGDEDENYVMMMCVGTSDEGLVVLPTHRVVKVEGEPSTLTEGLSQFFDTQEISDLNTLQAALEDPASAPRPGRFGAIIGGNYLLAQLKEGGAHQAAMDTSKSEAYRDLDVSILHGLILEKLLGIDAEKLAAGAHVSYTIDPSEALAKVQSGDYGAAFLMRSTPVEQVQAVAAAGDKMPQKSTYFYPKLYTGLVLRPIH